MPLKSDVFHFFFFTDFVMQVTSLQTELREQTNRCDSLSERLLSSETQSQEWVTSNNSLREEVERLRQEVKVDAQSAH